MVYTQPDIPLIRAIGALTSSSNFGAFNKSLRTDLEALQMKLIHEKGEELYRVQGEARYLLQLMSKLAECDTASRIKLSSTVSADAHGQNGRQTA